MPTDSNFLTAAESRLICKFFGCAAPIDVFAQYHFEAAAWAPYCSCVVVGISGDSVRRCPDGFGAINATASLEGEKRAGVPL
jgi:hypothetical protein